jgi:hypothetical protein
MFDWLRKQFGDGVAGPSPYALPDGVEATRIGDVSLDSFGVAAGTPFMEALRNVRGGAAFALEGQSSARLKELRQMPGDLIGSISYVGPWLRYAFWAPFNEVLKGIFGKDWFASLIASDEALADARAAAAQGGAPDAQGDEVAAAAPPARAAAPTVSQGPSSTVAPFAGAAEVAQEPPRLSDGLAREFISGKVPPEVAHMPAANDPNYDAPKLELAA